MASRILDVQGRDVIVSGLQWSPLVEKKRTKEILAHATSADAKKVVVWEEGNVAAVGLYAPLEDDDSLINAAGDKPLTVRHMYSAAALFSGMVGASNAVIAFTMPDKVRAAVIVLQAGQPIVDEIPTLERAQELATSYALGSADGAQYHLYTNDLSSFPSGQTFSMDDVWASVGKRNELTGKPVNYAALTLTIVLLCVAFGSLVAYQRHEKKRKLEEAIRRQREMDPRPQYDAALQAQQGKLGWDGESLTLLLNSLDKQPLYAVGWSLKKVTCRADTAVCASVWAREGGTTDRLLEARAAYGEEPLPDSTQSEVHLVFKLDSLMKGVTSTSAMPTLAQWAATATPLMQIWENAGVRMSVSRDLFHLWPSVNGVPESAVPPGEGLRAMATEVQATEELVREVAKSEPSNYYWQEISITPGETAEDPLDLHLKGTIYAR
jgi:hypothetical protein